jgi:hypothetical protein
MVPILTPLFFGWTISLSFDTNALYFMRPLYRVRLQVTVQCRVSHSSILSQIAGHNSFTGSGWMSHFNTGSDCRSQFKQRGHSAQDTVFYSSRSLVWSKSQKKLYTDLQSISDTSQRREQEVFYASK